ncbi:MAG TPA: helicase C-terminal domain-containing protein [Candidatus Hydrogenedentes bacterium]|nr:helicase C-terminal domain-containing protein [Candidatus Hydrogenedentota bacterium]
MAQGESILNRMTREAADQLHGHIQEAGGNEVFCAGSLDGNGLLAAVRVLARGHASAVPALFAMLELREVVLHNHPSGNLEPSDADLELASIYSAHGHGVYIVDNATTSVYVVVEPFLPRERECLNARELEQAFASDSMLARKLDGFELRPQQIEMTESIAAAFNNNGIALIEAPTGVGKTLAYLLPATLWALRNKERIVISTRTINLQEQIILHDLPLLRNCLGEEFNACLVKGRSNYVCLHKLDRAFSEVTLFEDPRRLEQLHGIVDWAEKTHDGSVSDLPFMPDRVLWERVCCEADMCVGGSCRHFRNCFFMHARRDMAAADLLVVNHHMLFADVAVKRETGDFSAAAVLPSYGRVILDEAHSIEDAATEYFGISATRAGMRKTMNRLLHVEGGQERGLLPFLKLKLMRNCPQVSIDEYQAYLELIEKQVQPAVLLTEDTLDDAFTALREYTSENSGQIGREIQWRLTPEILSAASLRELHEEIILPAVFQTQVLMRLAQDLLDKLKTIRSLEPGDESPVQLEVVELAACLRRMQQVADALTEFTEETLEDNTVRWIEISSRDEDKVRIARCPLAVGKPLAEWVYAKTDSIIMTSATLAVQKKFDYCKGRIGLDLAEAGRVQELLLGSPFDYKRQALLCVPTGGPDPNAPAFLETAVEHIRSILKITRGHAFVLFTSFGSLDFAYEQLEEELLSRGIRPLCQGRDSRSRLLQAFREDISSVLFGTDSFWEGVDVAGEALQCVIVTRLPFRVPTEPILEARAKAIEQAGGNAFMDFSVPQAVIKLRQGFGRLIRRRTDWGTVVVLDNRIVTKYYGRMFLNSLPDVPVVRGPAEKVWEALEKFYREKRSGNRR